MIKFSGGDKHSAYVNFKLCIIHVNHSLDLYRRGEILSHLDPDLGYSVIWRTIDIHMAVKIQFVAKMFMV